MIKKNTSLMQPVSIYFTYSESLHVSGRTLPIIRRIWFCTYQRLVLVADMYSIIFSWWWAVSCPKHVETHYKWNIYLLAASSWCSYLSFIARCFLFHPLLSFATFSSAYLFFYTPADSNLTRFSLLLLLLCVMCVQSNSICFYYLNLYWLLFGDSPLFFVCNPIGPFYIHYSSLLLNNI